MSLLTDANDIEGSWNGSTGVLTLSGPATKAHFESALESVTYNNTSENPNITDRTISWQINDGTDNSSVVTSTISLTSNDAPVLSGAEAHSPMQKMMAPKSSKQS